MIGIYDEDAMMLRLGGIDEGGLYEDEDLTSRLLVLPDPLKRARRLESSKSGLSM